MHRRVPPTSIQLRKIIWGKKILLVCLPYVSCVCKSKQICTRSENFVTKMDLCVAFGNKYCKRVPFYSSNVSTGRTCMGMCDVNGVNNNNN